MDGLCFLCLCKITDGPLPICVDCDSHLASLPTDQRMTIVQRLFMVESSRKLSNSISDVASQLSSLIELSRGQTGYYRN